MSFEQWMAAVDAELEATCGVGTMDLPDADYRDQYDSGASPADMAAEVLEANDWHLV